MMNIRLIRFVCRFIFEMCEDLYLSYIAAKNDSTSAKTYTHDDAWKWHIG